MFQSNRLHKDESGQTALETAIILIAFVVVASVFAFTILSAGQASTQKGEQAIYSGLQGVQSSMQIKGAVIAHGESVDPAVASTYVKDVVFTLQLVSGGEPIDLTDNHAGAGGAGTSTPNKVVINYRDATQAMDNIKWTLGWIGTHANDPMLEDHELATITVDTSILTHIPANRSFSIEIKPPTGSVIVIQRTTPPAISNLMELQ